MVERLARLSTRRMASRIGVSHMHVFRTLHEENYHQFHHQTVQHLEPGDHAQGLSLCHWIQAHRELLGIILFTDEATFTGDAMISSRRCGWRVTCNIMCLDPKGQLQRQWWGFYILM
jgi:hypothetical protein